MDIVCRLLQFYIIAIFARVILSWVRVSSDSPFAQVVHVIGRITDPVMVPLRRVIPPVRMGAVAMDLTPIIALIGVRIVQGFLCG